MEQRVCYLFYQSYIPLQGRKPQAVLQPIIKQAIRLNKKNQLSGILGYSLDEQSQQLQMIQYIEGSVEAVETVFAKIQQDTRHHQVTLLFEGSHKNRLFESWQMKLIDLHNYPFLFSEQARAEALIATKPKLMPIAMQNFQLFTGRGDYDMGNTNRKLMNHPTGAYSGSNCLKPNKKTKKFSQIKWNETKFSALIGQLQKDYQNSAQTLKKQQQEWDDNQPLWVQNRKLLVRVFIIWIILVVLMLMNVFSNASLF